jgi:hypothetical protein
VGISKTMIIGKGEGRKRKRKRKRKGKRKRPPSSGVAQKSHFISFSHCGKEHKKHTKYLHCTSNMMT